MRNTVLRSVRTVPLSSLLKNLEMTTTTVQCITIDPGLLVLVACLLNVGRGIIYGYGFFT
jgi:hypothetical protein